MVTVQDFLKNDNWVKRIDAAFSTYDVNKNGNVSGEDWKILVGNLEKMVPDRPDAIAKVRKCMLEFWTAFGLTKGVRADKEKFRELAAAYCSTEVDRMRRGEMTKSEMYNNAIFDVVDTNHDGCVTFEEYKVLMDASNFGEDAAKSAFNLLDKNKNGKIERKEFISSYSNFWFTLDDPDTKGMYGDKFE